MHGDRRDVQSQFTTAIALDSVGVTPWEFLQTNRRKLRNCDIDTDAIIMDFRVERHVTVSNDVDEAE